MKNKECCKEEGEEKDEVKMAMSDIPAAAREGLMRESNNAKIDKVDKETKDDKTVYEADVMMDGKNWEIVVDSSGNKVSKKIDEESEEHEGKGKKEKEEDDEKDEKK
jgi:hypothetical protein